MTDKKQRPSYSPEVRERAVRMVMEQGGECPSQWAAIVSIAGKIGCVPQTLHGRVAQAERDAGKRSGPSTEERERIKALERDLLPKTPSPKARIFAALEQALHDRRPGIGSGLVHHSDRGSQYVSIRYTERLAEAGLGPSVGSVGDSYDNALAETINGLYKAEVIWRKGPWKSIDAVEYATLEWVDWFRHIKKEQMVPGAERLARGSALNAIKNSKNTVFFAPS